MIVISFTFLPLVAIFPHKFSSLFSLGCLCIFVSLAILKGKNSIIFLGVKNFLSALMKREKIGYAIAYIVTQLFTLYFSIIYKSYIFTIIFSTLQVIYYTNNQILSLSFLIASNFPGGVTGMKFATKKCASCLGIICKKCFTSTSS